MLCFDRVSDREIARPLGVGEGADGGPLRPLESCGRTPLDSTDSQLNLLSTLHAGQAVHSAVFKFAPAQGVVVQTSRSLPSSSDRRRGHRSQPSLEWGKAGQRDSQRKCANLAGVAIELLLAVRKTFTRPAGASPGSTVCSSNVVRTGQKGFSRPPDNLLVHRSFGFTVARHVTLAESGPQERSQLPMTYSKTLTPLEPRTDAPMCGIFLVGPISDSRQSEDGGAACSIVLLPRRSTPRSTVRTSVEGGQCGRSGFEGFSAVSLWLARRR